MTAQAVTEALATCKKADEDHDENEATLKSVSEKLYRAQAEWQQQQIKAASSQLDPGQQIAACLDQYSQSATGLDSNTQQTPLWIQTFWQQRRESSHHSAMAALIRLAHRQAPSRPLLGALLRHSAHRQRPPDLKQ